MEPDKQLLEAWENAVALGNAWLVFAYAKNKKRFHELRRKGEHHGLQSHMERELIWRICDGDFQAFGIEHGSDAGPIPIPKYYFSKTVVVDWDRETVEAFGKKFHEVRVQGEREQEPPDETQPTELEPSPYIIDPREMTAQWERQSLDEPPLTVPRTSREPDEITDQGERGPLHEILPGEPAPSVKPQMGRPPLLPKIREVVRELIDRNEFENLMKKEMVALIRSRAKKLFPVLFPKPTQPSLNKINEALKAERWPPQPEK